MAASQPGATGNAQPRLPCAFSRRPEMRPSAFTAIPAWWCWREWFAAIRCSPALYPFDRPTEPEGCRQTRESSRLSSPRTPNPPPVLPSFSTTATPRAGSNAPFCNRSPVVKPLRISASASTPVVHLTDACASASAPKSTSSQSTASALAMRRPDKNSSRSSALRQGTTPGMISGVILRRRVMVSRALSRSPRCARHAAK